MTPEHYQRICQLFDEALERVPAERAAFLAAACGTDEALRAEVEKLLTHQVEDEEFLARPALQVAATLLAQNQFHAQAGKQLNHYELVALLGAGGMGEVWLARDSQLERKVALKLLPPHFTQNPEHLQRFHREARAASALNHPNILTIYEIGTAEHLRFISTEFIDGVTLRQRLAAGPLTLAATVAIIKQVASALDTAHQAGIIHRDIKPENVMIRQDGLVKVLDFGLAKLSPMPKADYGIRNEDGKNAATLMQSPTGNPHLTMSGLVMGTPRYMSPEQARGLKVDARTDVFSLGVMFYEMVAGAPPFPGATVAEALAALLDQEPPPLRQFSPAVPARLEEIIRRTLAKQRTQRYESMRAFIAELAQLDPALANNGAERPTLEFAADTYDTHEQRKATQAQPPSATLPGQSRPFAGFDGHSGLLKPASALAVVLVFAVAGYRFWSAMRNMPTRALNVATVTQLTTAPGQALYPSLSPDGQTLVYAHDEAGNWDIYLQPVSGATPFNLTKDSPANDTQPAFSPDGAQLVFRSDREGGGIFVMSATGAQARRVIAHGHNPAWSPNGLEIAFSAGSFARPSERSNPPSPLHAHTLASGVTRQVTTADAVQPNWSPHGHRIAYWGISSGGQRDIWTIGAQGGEPVAVTGDPALDWNPIWSPDGRYLFFASDRGGSMNLWRVPIDESSGRVLGAPEAVTTPATYCGYLSFSRDGRKLAYAQVAQQINIQQIGFDPVKGKVEAPPIWLTQGSRIATDPDLSSDKEWVVFGATGDKQEDLFVVRRDGTSLRQITNDKYKDRAPRWSPDGQQIVFFSDRSGRYEYWLIRPDGSGLRQFSHNAGAQMPLWSPAGPRVLCNLQTGPPVIVEVNQPWSEQIQQEAQQALPVAGFPAGLMISSWSANGRKLAGHGGGIYSYSFDTQQYERLTESGERPVWLNDNQRLLFFTKDKLYLLDSRTRQAQEILTGAPHYFQALSLSRDNRVLYFSLKTTQADIWLASLETEP